MFKINLGDNILYVFGIIICILISLYIFIYLKRVNLTLKYEIIEYNKVNLLIKIYIFNKKFYDYKNEYTYINVLEILAKGKDRKKNKINKQVRNSRKAINTIIKDLLKEKIHINIYVGNTNVILNCYFVTIISSLISIILAKNIKVNKINNVKYKVIPVYNQNNIIIDGKINCRIITLLKLFIRLKLMNKKGGKNGKSSNRKFNVNCNDKFKTNDRCRYNCR
ncbi:MAG: hypothetical protein E7311_02680 [Clostridiales bacterium]|nr:hypothetical protein [Clostridiales bacterium]